MGRHIPLTSVEHHRNERKQSLLVVCALKHLHNGRFVLLHTWVGTEFPVAAAAVVAVLLLCEAAAFYGMYARSRLGFGRGDAIAR